MKAILSEQELALQIDAEIYGEKVVFPCFYWYGRRFSISIDREAPAVFCIRLTPKEGELTEQEWIDVQKNISQDLIDFKLRAIVDEETRVVRELIIAKAFAHYDEPADPITEISDPVGFQPPLYE
jgi:His-Xaa-Ser system protein HxsD